MKSELPNAPIGDLIDAGDNLPGGLVDDDVTSDDSSSGLDAGDNRPGGLVDDPSSSDDSTSGLGVDDSDDSDDTTV